MNNVNNERLEYMAKIAKDLRISPLYDRFLELVNSGEIEKSDLSVQELVIDLLEYVKTSRLDRRTAKALKVLGLHNSNASIDNVLWNIGRTGISKRELTELNTCNWIRCHRNIIMIGPTGVGKTRIADSLAVSAVTSGFKVFYRRAPILISELRQIISSNEIRSYLNMLQTYALVYIDDFCTGTLSVEAESMLAEIADRLAEKVSFLITTQHDATSWLENFFITPGIGESFADRIYRPALRFVLDGPSLRDRKYCGLTEPDGTCGGTSSDGTSDGTKPKTTEDGCNRDEQSRQKNEDLSESVTSKAGGTSRPGDDHLPHETSTSGTIPKRRGRPPKNKQFEENSKRQSTVTNDGTSGANDTLPGHDTSGKSPDLPSQAGGKA